MTQSGEFTLGAIQAAPVYFDRDASVEKACELIEQAADKGATIVAFGETWLPGYPFFASYPADKRWPELAARYIENGIEIPGPETDRLCETARRWGLDVAIGVVERDRRTQGTVYCTLLFIGREGVILGRHRKLKPTQAERTIWGEGDGSSLRVYERDYARISGLNCWEHNMVLPGFSLMDQGTQVHVSTWPGGSASRKEILSQAFASQGACYVICVAGLLRPEDVREEWRDLAGNPKMGNSCIIDPMGNIIAGPVEGDAILTATGSLETIRTAKAIIDVAGHYSRPDVFSLTVNRTPTQGVSYSDPREPTSEVDGEGDFAPAETFDGPPA